MLHTLSFKHLLILPGADAAGKKKFRPGLQTSHRTSLRTSKQLLHMLNVAISSRAKGVPDVDRMVHEARACIFEKITRPFLRAFDRYLVPTWACGRSVTEEPYASDPFGRTLSLVELNFDTFPTPQDLASPGVIAVFKSTAISKHRMRNFYERFVAGPVFKAWWGEAREAAERECKVLHRTDVIEACVRGTGMGREMNVEGMNVRKTQECVADLMCRVQEEITKAVAGDYMLLTKLDALMESLVEVDTEDARRFAREKCLQREQMLSSAG